MVILFLMLLLLSNDRSLRRLGPKWWKRLQRSSYVAIALTFYHGFAFQYLEGPVYALGGPVGDWRAGGYRCSGHWHRCRSARKSCRLNDPIGDFGQGLQSSFRELRFFTEHILLVELFDSFAVGE